MTFQTIQRNIIEKALEESPDLACGLRQDEIDFLKRCYDRPLDNYLSRIEAIGFTGGKMVLDAGCGFGQWSLALSEKNETVIGLDVSASRVRVCRELAYRLAKDRLIFVPGSMNRLPFKDRLFDFIFCYGAIMFCDERVALSEFARVLKPGGKMYVCGNGIGLYLHFILNRGLLMGKTYYLKGGMKSIFNTLIGRRDRSHYSSRKRIQKILSDCSLVLNDFSSEGKINVNGQQPEPNYRGRYFGLLGVYEFIAQNP